MNDRRSLLCIMSAQIYAGHVAARTPDALVHPVEDAIRIMADVHRRVPRPMSEEEPVAKPPPLPKLERPAPRPLPGVAPKVPTLIDHPDITGLAKEIVRDLDTRLSEALSAYHSLAMSTGNCDPARKDRRCWACAIHEADPNCEHREVLACHPPRCAACGKVMTI